MSVLLLSCQCESSASQPKTICYKLPRPNFVNPWGTQGGRNLKTNSNSFSWSVYQWQSLQKAKVEYTDSGMGCTILNSNLSIPCFWRDESPPQVSLSLCQEEVRSPFWGTSYRIWYRIVCSGPPGSTSVSSRYLKVFDKMDNIDRYDRLNFWLLARWQIVKFWLSDYW